jgi:NAD(P)-dependent dehydrogenase (short-subunit alcohol dehydrogenase family)
MSGFTAKDVQGQSGKCFLVTGANTGLGFEAAKVLAARGGRVLLACRDEGKARRAMQRIRMETPGANLAFVPLDLADLGSVHACARLVREEPRLDVLINNAGVMFPPLQRTAQGHELQFGVNHLAHFALAGLLLPKLAETPGARLVITASIAHKRGRIDWDDLDAHKSYNRGQRYADSKLMNLLHLYELDRRLQAAGSPVSAIGCHPGVAATDLMRHSGPGRVFTPLLGLFLNTAEQGAWPTLQAATDPDAKAGHYYGSQGLKDARGKSGEAKRTAQAADPVLARRLWDISVEMTGVDPGLAPVDDA